MSTSITTGYAKFLLAGGSDREALKDKVVVLYGGTIPVASGGYTAAEQAAGQVLGIGSLSGATTPAKQKITITPVVGDANAASWWVTLNGVKVSFIDDGTPSVAEVCTGITNALETINGTAITTPASTVNIPDTYGLFTITNNTTNVTVEAATANVSFDYDSGVVGGTTATMVSVLTVDSAYGLQFEPFSELSTNVLTLKDNAKIIANITATGVITYGRIQTVADDGSLSTAYLRMQGNVATANAEIIVDQTNVTSGATISVSLAQIGKPTQV